MQKSGEKIVESIQYPGFSENNKGLIDRDINKKFTVYQNKNSSSKEFAKKALICCVAAGAIIAIGYFSRVFTSVLMVPSQRVCPNMEKSQVILEKAKEALRIEPFEITSEDGKSLQGIVYDGKKWLFNSKIPVHHDHCIVYHNPNAVVTSEIISGQDSDLGMLLQDMAKSPVIMYDYRGTGLNSNARIDGMWKFPTANSIVEDGEMMIQYAVSKCDTVDVFGTSLGGGVATKALDQYLQKFPEHASKFRLYNHDSFTNTARVILPSFPNIADWLGWSCGGFLDAETSMKNLLKRNITITILSSSNDSVIPAGARMSEIDTEDCLAKVAKIDSFVPSHASLRYWDSLNDLEPTFHLKSRS